MRWRLKSAAASLLSYLPGGLAAHRCLQVQILRSLPISASQRRSYVASARDHLDQLRRYGETAIETARFYEFGAGADLASAIAMRFLGVSRQMVTDVVSLAEPWLCQDVADYFHQCATELNLDPSLPQVRIRTLEDLSLLGIEYRAPVDARDTRLPAQSVDYVTSTSTMEHIPTDDVPRVMAECARLLRPGGVVSFYINYADHYAASDPSIGAFNFLQFGERAWSFHNSPLHYQNRLRHVDYLKILHSVGFDVLADKPTLASEPEVRMLETMSIDPMFSKYALSELAVKNATIVARPR